MELEKNLIPMGVSSCLLGTKVRYHGGHAKDSYITDTLGVFFRFFPVCPEVECGLGVPRETLRLEGNPKHPCLITTQTKIDHTSRMHSWIQTRLIEFNNEDICGFIFKKKSPSCGLFRMKIYPPKGPPSLNGVGLFARAFTERFPRIPVEEEGRLNDAALRENFIERVFVLQRWREHLKSGYSKAGLVEFHARHKLLILSHSTTMYKEMGRWVATMKDPIQEVYDQYEELLLTAMALKATVSKHANVLQHMLGYFKRHLSANEKQEMIELIDGFRNGHFPLIVPVTTFNHYAKKYGEMYLANQVYLNPHPVELKLRNHA
jgi:uncharacterized protein YbgA (DUF1722 family)/uncharacterized protein YbbK (DUF523 family)